MLEKGLGLRETGRLQDLPKEAKLATWSGWRLILKTPPFRLCHIPVRLNLFLCAWRVKTCRLLPLRKEEHPARAVLHPQAACSLHAPLPHVVSTACYPSGSSSLLQMLLLRGPLAMTLVVGGQACVFLCERLWDLTVSLKT